MMTVLVSIGFALIAGVIGYMSALYLGKNNPVEQQCEKIRK